MMTRSEDVQALTTALSTLSARVAVLERWMRRAQRQQVALMVMLALAIVGCAWLVAMR